MSAPIHARSEDMGTHMGSHVAFFRAIQLPVLGTCGGGLVATVHELLSPVADGGDVSAERGTVRGGFLTRKLGMRNACRMTTDRTTEDRSQHKNNNMKIQNSSSKKRMAGVTMTEYLILLALVAIASLVMTSAFGNQVQVIYHASINALMGNSTAAQTGTATAAESNTMADFANRVKK